MYKNVGAKIKSLASITAWIGIIASMIIGIALIATSKEARHYGSDELSTVQVVIGLAVMVLGSFFSWLGSIVLYGFGELVEKTSMIEENTRLNNTQMGESAAERIERLNKLLNDGVITLEEYNKALFNRK